MEVVDVSSMEEINATIATRQGFVLRLTTDTSLKDAKKIHARMTPHHNQAGHALLNADVVERKEEARDALLSAVDKMKRRWKKQSAREMEETDAMIAQVAEKLLGEVPHAGPPLAERGRGFNWRVFPGSMPIAPYHLGGLPQKSDKLTKQQKAALKTQDEKAQRAFWQLHLDALKIKKQLQEEMGRKLQEQLDELVTNAEEN